MGITVLPLTMTAEFLTGALDLPEAEFYPNVLSQPLPTRFRHTHPVKENVWWKYQATGYRVPCLFHPLFQAARPLKIEPTRMPPHIIDDINRRRDEANIDRRPYAPSPVPPGEIQHHSNIDGDSDETGERGVVIIDFEI